MSPLRAFDLAHARVAFVLPPTSARDETDRGWSSFRFGLGSGSSAPLVEAECAGAVRAAGGTSLIVDAPAARWSTDRVRDELRRFAPDLIVVSVTDESLDHELVWITSFATEFDRVTFAVHGAPCATHAATILERAPRVSFCVRADHEPALDAIVREGHASAPGVVRRGEHGPVAIAAQRGADLDGLPWPDRSSFDAGCYRVRGIGAVQASVRVQRDDVHPENGIRRRSPKNIAEEMALVRAQGMRWFDLRAQDFSLDRSWAFSVCAAIARAVPDARWVTTTGVGSVDEDLVAAMATAGCYGIRFGFHARSSTLEVGASELVGHDLAAEAMRICDRHDVLSRGSLTIGSTGETVATLDAIGAFVRVTRPDLLTIHDARVHPGASVAQAAPALVGTEMSRARRRRVVRTMLTRHDTDPRVLASVARKSVPLFVERCRELWLPAANVGAGVPTPSSVRPR